jgi:hypothetical protein
MNYLNTISVETKRNVDRLIGLLDPTSDLSLTNNVIPNRISPKSHVTHALILRAINRDSKLSKLNLRSKNYLRRLVETYYGSVSRTGNVFTRSEDRLESEENECGWSWKEHILFN